MNKSGREQINNSECGQNSDSIVIIPTYNSAIAPMADQVIHFKNGSVERIIRNEKPVPVDQIEW